MYSPKRISIFLLLAASLLIAVPAVHADTVVDISATYCSSCGFGSGPVNLGAQLTVEQVTGNFFNSGMGYVFNGTVYEVTSITGTLNGNAITSFTAPLGQGSWLNLDLSLGSVYFSVAGSEGWLEFDGTNTLLEISNPSGYGSNTPIQYSAGWDAPEPGSLILLLAGLAAILLVAAKKS